MSRPPEYGIPVDPSERNAWLLRHGRAGRFPDWISVETLPPVDWVDGTKAPTVPVVALLRSTRDADQQAKTALRDLLDPASMARLVWHVFDSWNRSNASGTSTWIWDSIASWGDEITVARIGNLARTWPKQRKSARVRNAIDMFSKHGGATALGELDFWASSATSPALRRMACERLDEIAAQRGLAREDLSDSVVPTYGLSDSGFRVFELPRRRFVLELRSDLSVLIVDVSGKPVKSGPRPLKSEGPLEAAAIESLKLAKRSLPELIARQRTRLEQAMVHARSWTADRWRSVFLRHPILRVVAQQVVWSVLRAEHNTELTIRVAEDFTLADVRDEPVSLDSEGAVRVSHPLFWNDETRRAWKALFDDYQLKNAFDQIDRATFTILPPEMEAHAVSRFVGHHVDSRLLLGRLRASGWTMGPTLMGPISFVAFRAFDGSDLTAVLHHSGVYLDRLVESMDVELRDIAFVHGAQTRIDGNGVTPHDRISVGAVPSIVFSETLRDVSRIIARTS